MMLTAEAAIWHRNSSSLFMARVADSGLTGGGVRLRRGLIGSTIQADFAKKESGRLFWRPGRFADHGEQSSFPRMATAAKRLGMSESACHRSLQELAALGFVGIEKRYREDGAQDEGEATTGADYIGGEFADLIQR